MTIFLAGSVIFPPSARISNRCPVSSTRRVIFQPMARRRAPVGSIFDRWHAAKLIFNRWHVAKHPTAHFLTDGTLPSSILTDGTLPSTQRLIF